MPPAPIIQARSSYQNHSKYGFAAAAVGGRAGELEVQAVVRAPWT